jgi:RHS repeat-associated protein
LAGGPPAIDSTTTAIYDAFNNAVEKTASGATTEVFYTPVGKTATMTGQTVVKFFLPLPGGAGFEFITSGGYQLFHHKDGQGSSRFVSKRALQASYYDTSFAPFGEDYNGSGTSAELNFTDQRQDLVAGTYDFPARKYNPKQGRWISPDPAGLGAVSLGNPQSWNRYAYVGGNPLAYVDPSGLEGKDLCNVGGEGDDGTGDSVSPEFFKQLVSQFEVRNFSGRDLFVNPVVDFVLTFSAESDGNPQIRSAFGFNSIGVNIAPPNNGSWGWNFTKSFFGGFTVFGPKNDPRPSCFGQFLADAGSGFVNSFAPPGPSPGEIVGVTTATLDYANEVGIVAEQHLAQYGSRISKYTIGEQAGARAGLAGLLANADYQGAVALVNEYGSASSGQCK